MRLPTKLAMAAVLDVGVSAGVFCAGADGVAQLAFWEDEVVHYDVELRTVDLVALSVLRGAAGAAVACAARRRTNVARALLALALVSSALVAAKSGLYEFHQEGKATWPAATLIALAVLFSWLPYLLAVSADDDDDDDDGGGAGRGVDKEPLLHPSMRDAINASFSSSPGAFLADPHDARDASDFRIMIHPSPSKTITPAARAARPIQINDDAASTLEKTCLLVAAQAQMLLISYAQETDWSFVSDRSGVQIYKKPRMSAFTSSAIRALPMVKSVMTLSVPAKNAFAALMDVSRRAEWDRGCRDAAVLQTIGPDTDVTHHVYRSSWFGRGRGAVLARKWRQYEGAYLYFCASISSYVNDNVPMARESRAVVACEGAVVAPLPRDSSSCLVTHVHVVDDFGEWTIPGFANRFVASHSTSFADFRQMLYNGHFGAPPPSPRRSVQSNRSSLAAAAPIDIPSAEAVQPRALLSSFVSPDNKPAFSRSFAVEISYAGSDDGTASSVYGTPKTRLTIGDDDDDLPRGISSHGDPDDPSDAARIPGPGWQDNDDVDVGSNASDCGSGSLEISVTEP